MAGLNEYSSKRHFGETDEPAGRVQKKHATNLRFVVQHHIARRDHYDFRLEWDGVLKSWAVPKGPSYNTHDKRLAVQVEDHPLEYRHFEGTIPKGQYGGGVVMLWDEGKWKPNVDAEKGLKDGSLKFQLEGSRLKGSWALVRMKPKPGEGDNNWLLIKERDEYASSVEIKQFNTSIETGRTMNEIKDGKASMANKGDQSGSRPGKGTGKAHAGKRPSASKRVVEEFGITNPDKVLYEKTGITKGNIAGYYYRMAEQILPYIENRIISVVRCPRGVDGDCFFKKHPTSEKSGIVSIDIPTKGEKKEEYFYIENTKGLMHEVQMNTLEFHTWGSSVKTLEKPDIMVFDLDPDEGLDLDKIRQGVKDLKQLLDQLSLVSFLKTSGGKGYHVVIPFKPVAGWNRFHDFAQNVAKTMEAAWPDRYTSNVRKANRKDRIFIDWIRNGRGATSVAPYSVRAREGAPVSMPIQWRELDSITPQGIAMEDAIARLRRKDPWEDFFRVEQQLK